MPRTTLKKKSGNRNDTKTEVRNEDYRAILLRNGKVELLCLVEGKCRDQGIIVFPEKDGPAYEISCVELTPEFFIFGTKSGSILYYHLNHLGPNFVGEHKHGTGGIRRLWPNKLGTRLLFEDGNHGLYLHNPLNDQFCIVSGRHMVLDDWTACPKCQFPALMSQFVKALDAENTCPMCLEVVSIEELKLMDHLKNE